VLGAHTRRKGPKPRARVRSRATRFVRTPNLVAYWKDGSFVIEDFLRRRQITAAPYAILLLAAFSRPRSFQDVAVEFPQYDARSVEKEARKLARLGFLESASGKGRLRDLFHVWRDSFPAIYYQSLSRDVLYVTDPAETRTVVRDLLADSPQPKLHKDYRRKGVVLPKDVANPDIPLGNVLRGRRTVREFGKRRVAFSDFAGVIRGTWGQTSWLDAGPFGKLIAKTSPSAGARHPIECYVIAWRVEGLSAGLYHYNVRRDRLERLRLGDFRAEAVRIASGQKWVRGAAFLCVMTAVADRVFWKYRTADAYRLFFLDAGHLAQTFTLLASERGLGPFTTAALQEKRIERFLGLDGIAEFPVYLCGAGAPVRGGPKPLTALDPISSSPRR
jgi:SagB-type dehydrogenase family enzyme